MKLVCSSEEGKVSLRGRRTVVKNRQKRSAGQQVDKRAENDGFSEPPPFQRDDWTLFRNLNTLGQRAGVMLDDIPALVVKELTDNALDTGHGCRFGKTEDGAIYVEDHGTGLPGTDAEVAALLSVARPLSSSKLLRRPTMGAFGHGLRVVVGGRLAPRGGVLHRAHRQHRVHRQWGGCVCCVLCVTG